LHRIALANVHVQLTFGSGKPLSVRSYRRSHHAGRISMTDTVTDRRIQRDARGLRSAQSNKQTGDRLPVPPRERRPALAALAVLLILGGAAISGLVMLRTDERTPVLVFARDIATGQEITPTDLAVTRVAADNLRLVPADQKNEIIGRYAGVSVPAGTPVGPGMLRTEGLLAKDNVAVGLALKPGHLPANGVQLGDRVDIVLVPTTNSQPSGNRTQDVLVRDARVSGYRPDQASATTLVTVVVPRSKGPDVAGAGAIGAISLVLVSRGESAGS
jgi:Flp pilus assembly protein CpaB